MSISKMMRAHAAMAGAFTVALSGGTLALAQDPGPGHVTQDVAPFEDWPTHWPAPLYSGPEYKTSLEHYEALKAKAGGGVKLTFAQLPAWTGVWERAITDAGLKFDPAQTGDFFAGQLGPTTASLTREYQKKLDLNLANVAKGIEWDPLSECMPAGYPRWLGEPFLREAIVRPEEVWLATEQNNEFRRIYLDGRGHMPEDEAYPLWEGDSIGFWRGSGDAAVLTIHTNHLKAGMYQRSQPEFSDEVSTVEEIRLVDHNTLWDRVTIYDPKSLRKPWHMIQRYTRVTDPSLRINHWSCEENKKNAVVKTSSGATDFAPSDDFGPKAAPAAKGGRVSKH